MAADDHDELAAYRANLMARSTRHPSASTGGRQPRRTISLDAPPDTGALARDLGEDPDEDEVTSLAEDVAAAARDLAAAARDIRTIHLPDADPIALDRLLAARDRAAAAFDRTHAALDRHRAAEYLRRTYRDSVTGTLQREAGREQLAHEVDRAHRTNEQLTVAFLD